jgi:hypothetical protein
VYTGPKTGLDIDFGPCQEYDPVCNNCNHYNCGCPQSTACDGLYAEACQNQNNQGNVGAMTANNLTIHHQMVLRYWSYIYQSGNGGDPYIALCIFYPEICQIINNKLSDSNQPEGVRERLREINIELHNFGSRYGQGENRRILENCFGQLSEIEIEEVNGLLRSESSRLRDIFLYISETTGRLRASASNRNYGLNN